MTRDADELGDLRLFRVRPVRVLLVLITIHLVVFIVYLAGRWVFFTNELDLVNGHLVRLTDMGGEATIPTWISIVQLLTAATLLFAIALSVRAAGGRWRHWLGLGVVMTYISMDEQAEIHEILVTPLQGLWSITTGPFLLAWVIPALVAVALIVLIYMRFLLALPRRTFVTFLVAGLIYVGGAVGMEMVDAVTYERLRDLGSLGTAIKAGLYGVEELLEMIGVAVLIFGLLTHLRDHVPRAQRIVLSP